MNAIVPTGGNPLMPTNMDSAFRLAEMMARGKLVPQHLHSSPGDCLMVIEASMRWGMSPFAVAQCTSVIQGKLMFEGKLVAAALNASGIMAARLEYDFTGEGVERAVTVRGTLKGEAKPRDITLTLKDAKTTNGMWVKQPDQQLVYAGTRAWARRHAPEVMLGVYAPEEFDKQPDEPAFAGKTIDAEPPPPEQPPAEQPSKVGLWIDKTLPMVLLTCTTTAELEAFQRDNKVYAAAMQKASDSERRDMLARILERAGALMSDDADAGPADLDIVGQEKVGAG